MVCQLCVDGETCPDCEKYRPHISSPDVHYTPPGQYSGGISAFIIDLRTPEERITMLEQDVHDLKNKMQALMMKMEMMGK